MANRPADLPSWADSGDIVAPNEPTRDAGFTFRFPPTYQLMNWAWNRFGAWLKHFAEHSTTFDSLESACVATGQSPLEVGQTCLIDEDDSEDLPLTVADAIAFAGLADYDARAVAACADGVIVALSDDGATVDDPLVLRRVDRDGTASAVTYATSAGLPLDTVLRTDGAIVVLGGYTTVEAWDWTTGALLWDVDSLTAAAGRRGVTFDTDHVYYVDGDDVVAVERLTGTEVWRYDHGATVTDVATDGQNVYLIGLAGTGGATLRRLRASDGADDGTDTFGWSTDPTVFAVFAALGTSLAIDAERLYVSRNTSGTAWALEARSKADGAQLWSFVPSFGGSDVAPVGLSIDQDYLWYSLAGAWGQVDPRTGALLNAANDPAGPVAVNSTASDGAALWVAVNGDEGAPLLRVRRGNRIRSWRRVDPTARTYLPLQQRIIPA